MKPNVPICVIMGLLWGTLAVLALLGIPANYFGNLADWQKWAIVGLSVLMVLHNLVRIRMGSIKSDRAN